MEPGMCIPMLRLKIFSHFILIQFNFFKRMSELMINGLVKIVTFQRTTSKHVNDMMLNAFPFIEDTGYVPLKFVKKEGKVELIKVENRMRTLDLIKE